MAWDRAVEVRRMDLAQRQEDADRADQTCLVRYWDKYLQEVGEEGRYLDITFTYTKNAPGGLKMRLSRDTLYFDHLFRLDEDGVGPENRTAPITVDTKAFRWDGYITRVALVRDDDGVEYIDVEAIHCWQHIATTALWASPFAPILAQWPRHMVLFGPTESLIGIYMSCNLIRQQSSAYPGQWSDAPEWVRAGDSLWPIAMVPVWILTDTSKWAAGSARFDMASEFFSTWLDDSGVVLEAKFFLPGEDEQPAPEWFYLDKPTVVLWTTDKSGVTGPTGTLIDGLVSWFEDFIDDTTPVRYPNFNAQHEYEAIYGEHGPLGTFRNFPHVWYLPGEYSGIGASEVAVHKPLATSVIVGGKSPGWVNAGIEIAMKNLLSWVGLLIGIPGLDSLYQGQLDDVFLAWMSYSNAERTREAGPFAFKEHVVANSTKAFTLDGVMAGRAGLWATRGYTSHKVSVGDGAPYLLGKDFTLGDQIGFQLGDQIFTDFVTQMSFTDDRQGGARWELTIGDGGDEDDTITKAWNRLGQLATAVQSIATDVGADLDLLIF
ncbi:Gp37-like protein [Nocardia rhizosphaerae]|uniref:Phage tail protein n=1 Tax=Nocardia rhizosphaerae TaxID=1691571 RepID=A0ABV8L354_9NOCA